MTTPRVDTAIRYLRAKALIWRLCDLAGCPRKPYALRKWWHLHHEVENDDTRTWYGYFKGVTPEEALRETMYADFPLLRALFDSPVWLALSADPALRPDWDRLAEGIRIGDQSLGAYNSRASSQLFSRVDWPCFGLMIILLRTQSDRFRLHREWLKRNFHHFFYLACLQTLYWDFRLELYAVLTELLETNSDPSKFKGWPGTVEEFQCQLDAYYFLFEGIKALNWLPHSETQQALLMWTLMEADSGFLTYIATVHGQWPIEWPLRLRRIWLRRIKLWQAMPITLDHYRVPDP